MRKIVEAIVIAAVGAGLAFLGGGGCSPNTAATEKCKDQIHGGGDCANRCKRNGASEHEYVTGSTYNCLN